MTSSNQRIEKNSYLSDSSMIHKILKPILKRLIFFLLLVISFGFTGCASHKKINRLAQEMDCRKTILFLYDEAGDSVIMERKGFSAGNSPYPDYKLTMQKSIEELNKHTTANLLFRQSLGFPSDSVIQVKVLIKDITWTFGVWSALMETELIYQLDNKKIDITGENKVYLAGTKKGNLFKSLKDGHYQLLNYICK